MDILLGIIGKTIINYPFNKDFRVRDRGLN